MGRRTINGLGTDIDWIKKTLENYEERFDRIEQKLEGLVAFKEQVKTEARIQARITSIIIAIVPTAISFALLLLRIFRK